MESHSCPTTLHAREASSTEIEAIVARAKAGDRGAFDSLVERYMGRVYNIALRITGSTDEAQDCAQEAFVRAFSAIAKFRGEAAFSTWLYRVTVNAANDAVRRLKSRPALETEMARTGTDDPAPEVETLSASATALEQFDDEIARRQKRDVVLSAIRSLPEHHRTVIVLYDLQGLSYDEVAGVVGVHVGTVKSRLNRARLALKERLEPHLELLRG